MLISTLEELGMHISHVPATLSSASVPALDSPLPQLRTLIERMLVSAFVSARPPRSNVPSAMQVCARMGHIVSLRLRMS